MARQVGQRILARPENLAGRAWDEPGDEPQEGSLTRAVTARQHQRAPRLQAKGNIREDQVVPPESRHAPDLKHA